MPLVHFALASKKSPLFYVRANNNGYTFSRLTAHIVGVLNAITLCHWEMFKKNAENF